VALRENGGLPSGGPRLSRSWDIPSQNVDVIKIARSQGAKLEKLSSVHSLGSSETLKQDCQCQLDTRLEVLPPTFHPSVGACPISRSHVLATDLAMCVAFFTLDHPDYALCVTRRSLCVVGFILQSASCTVTGTSISPDPPSPPASMPLVANNTHTSYQGSMSKLGAHGLVSPRQEKSPCCK